MWPVRWQYSPFFLVYISSGKITYFELYQRSYKIGACAKLERVIGKIVKLESSFQTKTFQRKDLPCIKQNFLQIRFSVLRWLRIQFYLPIVVTYSHISSSHHRSNWVVFCKYARDLPVQIQPEVPVAKPEVAYQ